MRHWTPPQPPPNGPMREPWEIAVDVAGLLLLLALATIPIWLGWVA